MEKYRDALKVRLAGGKANQEDLVESQAQYKSLFDHAGVAMVLTDLRTGEVVAFN